MQDQINKIKNLQNRIHEAWKILRISEKKGEIEKLEKQISDPDFWNNQENARKISQKLANLKEEAEGLEKIKKEIEDLLEITELDKDNKSVNLREEILEKLDELEKQYKRLEFTMLFSDENDKNNCVLSIHAGTGGTDAQDWAEMLLRMFLRFCEKKNFGAKIIDQSRGDEAGIKSAVIEISGNYAFGWLKSEAGVHRLVRISPFDAEKMRHTSFALVEVLPEMEDIEIEIKDDDLRIDTFCASGHGGQSVNTTYSAVRITHLSTKISVSCQNERSQKQNKETAMKILRSKLFQYYQTEIEEERQKLKGEYKQAVWGNQIRSYVLHPYRLVKDHRTEYETTKTEKVLDGELEKFMEEFLRKNAGK